MEIGQGRALGWMLLTVVGLATQIGLTQTPAEAPAQQGTTVQRPAPTLQMQTLGQPGTSAQPQGVPPKDPFPAPNLKFFTAKSPSVETVNGFLKALWGYDPNRIWRVEAIQATAAPDVSKVVVFVSEKTPNAKVQTSAFFVTPDGKHILAGDSVSPFGNDPFAETRALLKARADGPARGAAGKDLLLVEFADLQCPHCKEAQPTMDRLVHDFPEARVVYQNFPLSGTHPFAFKAAAYGVCITKQKPDAFFPFVQAVYDAQGGLTDEAATQTLNNAVTKVGLSPGAIGSCAATPAIREQINTSIKLAEDVGVDQTPMLAINGRLLPINQVPYETLKSVISYQASRDGVSLGGSPAAGK